MKLSEARIMLGCHWSRRRLQRYLDSDPSAPLLASDVTRLEHHLAQCVRCQRVAREHRALRGLLSRWSDPTFPDPAAVARLRDLVDELASGPS
jgi:anti-sigma factor RsiW